jgi:GTP pyrophosphokinase
MDLSKETLIRQTKELFSPENLLLAERIYDEALALKLNERMAAVGFLSKTEILDPAAKKQLSTLFSAEIIEKSDLLKRIGNLSIRGNKKNISQIRKLFIELTDDVSIIILKLIERLITLKRAEATDSPELYELSEDCLYFYSQVAQMLGIRRIYQGMEDISFKTIYPRDFILLNTAINDNLHIYKKKLAKMESELSNLLKSQNIQVRIQFRVKRPYSIHRKLVNQKTQLNKIFDLLALRVITQEKNDCYVILGHVHSRWLPIDGRFKDWITFPKPNGYRSIQTTVTTNEGDKFEIQIRTEEMHEEAEYGSSAHWAYKQGTHGSGGNWLKTLHEFLENDEYFDNPFEFFENLKAEMRRNYINVLTPKGEIVSLIEGSTPIDFAFAIHTNLGFKITGANVNHKFAKLKTELKSGDVVEVFTSNTATPSMDWLSFVKTNRARNRIARWFKKNKKDVFIAQGRNAWDKLKLQYKKKLQGFEDELSFRKRVQELGYETVDDYYYAISSRTVKCSFMQLKKMYPAAFAKQTEVSKNKEKVTIDHSIPIIAIEGLRNIQTTIAKCCNPAQGVPIVAYVTSKAMIKIHASECRYLKRTPDNTDHFKDAEWLEV